MSLHDRIMREVDAFPFNTMSTHVNRQYLETYVEGFDRAKNQAAKLAKEADELMAEMADILWSASIGCAVNNKAADAVEKYNAWKERAQ